MDEMLMCDVCSSKFNSTCVIPKVLPCGHSFCSPCIIQVIATNSVCPKCRHAINGSEGSLPINYAILGIIDAVKATEKESGLLLRSFEVLKKKYMLRKDILLKKKSEVGSYLDEIESSLEIIESGLTKLQELINTDNNEIHTRRAKTFIAKLENDYKETEIFAHFMLPQIRISTAISLTSFENTNLFLTEICHMAQNDAKIFAVKQIQDKLQYGKISVDDSLLYLHSLTLSEVPEDSSLIMFDELKQCKNFCTFLKLSEDEKEVMTMVIIEMFDRPMSDKFTRLCTGECGTSYKDSYYTKGDKMSKEVFSILKVERERDMKSLSDNYQNYGHEYHQFKFSGYPNDTFLRVQPEGNFDIYYLRSKVDTPELPHGQVIFPKKFNSIINCYNPPSYSKIFDCGIVFCV